MGAVSTVRRRRRRSAGLAASAIASRRPPTRRRLLLLCWWCPSKNIYVIVSLQQRQLAYHDLRQQWYVYSRIYETTSHAYVYFFYLLYSTRIVWHISFNYLVFCPIKIAVMLSLLMVTQSRILSTCAVTGTLPHLRWRRWSSDAHIYDDFVSVALYRYALI